MLLFCTLVLCPLPVHAEPELVGEAAALIDSRNEQLLFEKNSNKRMYPASTTKILTAIIALERGNLEDIVSIPRVACNIEGSAIGLQEEEKITLEDLLYALMLNSGNDTAVAIACHIGGSVEEFARMMNELAVRIGAENSNFKNPTGLPDPDHYTTARDMALIAHYAMQNPEFRKIVSTRSATISGVFRMPRFIWRIPTNFSGIMTALSGLKPDIPMMPGSVLFLLPPGRTGNDCCGLRVKEIIFGAIQDIAGLRVQWITNISLIDAGKYVAEVPVQYGVTETVPVQTGFSLTYNIPVNSREKIEQGILLDSPLLLRSKPVQKLASWSFVPGTWNWEELTCWLRKILNEK